MAKRGAVTLTDSDGKAYTLKFGVNAICAIQDALGKKLGEIMTDLKDENALDMKTIRTMVKLSAVEPKELSDDQAGDLIDDVGLEQLMGVFSAAFTKREGEANPPASSS